MFPTVTEKAESSISIPDAERWALRTQGGRSWGVSSPLFFKIEFLKLTSEWKLVIGFQQIKVRFGCKARTHESDGEEPACTLAAATEALEAPSLGAGDGLPRRASSGRRSGASGTRLPSPPAAGGGAGALCSSVIPWPLLAAVPCKPVDCFWERNSKSVDLDSPPQSPPSP